MLTAARERVYAALSGPVLGRFKEELAAMLRRGGKVVVVTDPVTLRDESLRAALPDAIIYPGQVAPEQIRVIVDSTFVLTGELTQDAPASCLYSDQKHLADLFKSALGNEIRLIELGDMLPREG